MRQRRDRGRLTYSVLGVTVFVVCAQLVAAAGVGVRVQRAAAAASLTGGPAAPSTSEVVSPGVVAATSVDPASGALQTRVSIGVPPFHGLEPRLAIAYSSNAQNGWLGVGWTLDGLSYINRQSLGFGTPTFGGSDIFTLDGAQLVGCGASQGSQTSLAPSCRYPVSSSGSYFTTRREADLVIKHSTLATPDSWSITDPSGITRQYVPDVVANPLGSAPGIARWHLSSVQDLLGNTVTFSYTPTAPVPHVIPVPKSIDYNGTSIVFYSEDRSSTDRMTSAIGGDFSQLLVRLKTIDVVVKAPDGTLQRARTYALKYANTFPNASAVRSVLSSVTTYGRNASVATSGASAGTVTGVPLSTVTLTTNSAGLRYPLRPNGSSPETPVAATMHYPSVPNGTTVVNTAATVPTSLPFNFSGSAELGTIDGSGRAGSVTLSVFNKTLTDCGASLHVKAPLTSPDKTQTLSFPGEMCPLSGSTSWWLADVNGDGRDDLVVAQPLLFTTEKLTVFLNQGDNTFGPANAVTTLNLFATGQLGITRAIFNCEPGDVDGDGRAALVCLSNGFSQSHVPLVAVFRWTPGANDSFQSTPPASQLQTTNTPFFPALPAAVPTGAQANRDLSFHLADLNGDGRLDIVKEDRPTNSSSVVTAMACLFGFQTSFSIGTRGWTAPVFSDVSHTSCPGAYGSVANIGATNPITVGDVNGDGLPDLIGLVHVVAPLTATVTGFGVVSFLNRGDGTFVPSSSTFQSLPAWLFPNLFSGGGVLSFETGNIDGSGVAGLMLVVAWPGSTTAQPCGAGTILLSHPTIIRAPSNGDGSFALPNVRSDCLHVQQLNTFGATTLAQLFQGTGSPVWQLDQPASTSVRGNGLIDFIMLQKFAQDRPTFVIGYTPQSATSNRDWQPASLTSNEATGFATIEPDQAPFVRSLVSGVYHEEQLPAPPTLSDHTVIAPTVQRDWHILETQPNGQPISPTATGKSSLVYVDSDNNYKTVVGNAVQAAIAVVTYVPGAADGTWNATPIVLAGRPKGELLGDWMPADVLGTGASGLVRLEILNNQLAVVSLTPTATGSWAEFTSATLSVPSTDLDQTWRVTDVNGDGRADLIHIGASATSTMMADTLTGLGNGKFAFASHPLTGGAADPSQGDWLLGDINADGRADIVHIDVASAPAHLPVQEFLGLGDATWKLWVSPDVLPSGTSDGSVRDGAWALSDTNSDGYADLVHIAPVQSQSGTSAVSVFVATQTANQQFRSVGSAQYSVAGSAAYGWLGLDLDQDGVPDIAQVRRTPTGLTIARVFANKFDDRLTAVTNGLGATAHATYGSDGGDGCSVPFGVALTTVRNLTITPGPTTITYAYACAQWSSELHTTLGFQQTTSTRAASLSTRALISVTTRKLTENCGAQTMFARQSDTANHLISQAATAYDPPGGGISHDCKPASTATTQCGTSGATQCPTAQTRYTYDQYGNVTTQADTEPTSPKRTITTTFDYSLAPYLVDLPASTTLADAQPISRTTYCYDNSCTNTPTQGLLTTVAPVDLTTGQPAETLTYTYDTFGNRLTTTDAASPPDTTTTTYDTTYNIFPTETDDALGHPTKQSWDQVLGLPLTTTDPNGLSTTYQYDEYGRPTATLPPTGAATHISYTNFGDPARQAITTTTDDGSADGQWTTVRFDGLGRPYLVARKAATPSTAEATTTTYADASDRALRQSHWATTSTPLATPVTLNAPTETYAYDPLGQLVTQTHADGSSARISYSATSTALSNTATDESNKSIATQIDAWGRQVAATQATSTARYGYDSADHLTTITDPNGLVTSRTWNSLGHITAEASPDTGTQTFAYNAVGDLDTNTDARGHIINYRYDAIHRLVSEQDVDGSGGISGAPFATEWHYDEPNHGASIGQLTTVIDPSAAACPNHISKSILYDDFARPTATTQCVANEAQTTAATYDTFGRLSSTIYPADPSNPNGEQVTLAYDAAGRPKSFGQYVTDATYDPSGQLTDLHLGDGSDNQYRYDANRGWLTTISDQTPANTGLYDANFQRNADGTIATETSTNGGNNRSYIYDALNRVTNISGDTSQQLTYDAAGNILTNSAVGDYNYGDCLTPPCQPAAQPLTQQVRGAGDPASGMDTFQYDPNGNLSRHASPTRQQVATTHGSLNTTETCQAQPLNGPPTNVAVPITIATDASPSPHQGNQITLSNGTLQLTIPGTVFQDDADHGRLTDGQTVTLTAGLHLSTNTAAPTSANLNITTTAVAHIVNGQVQDLTATFAIPNTLWQPQVGHDATITQATLSIDSTVVHTLFGIPITVDLGTVTCNTGTNPRTVVTIPAGGTAISTNATDPCSASYTPAVFPDQPVDIPLTLNAIASPTPHAGRPVSTGNTTATVQIPATLLQGAVTAAGLPDGSYPLAGTLNIKLDGANTNEATQTISQTATATLTVVSGQAQDLTATLNMPNTTWHPSDATQAVTIRQDSASISSDLTPLGLPTTINIACQAPTSQTPLLTDPGGDGTVTNITWNGYNQPTASTTSNYGTTSTQLASLTTTYGAFGNLDEQQSNDSSGTKDIRYLGPLVTSTDGNLIKNFFFDGMQIARSNSTGTYYFHSDQLGSPRVITAADGTVHASSTYTPWGTSSKTGDRLDAAPNYTGAQQLSGTNLVQLGARVYDPELGRFLSADSVDPAGPTTQGANRYAYADDNPINNTDRTGHCDGYDCSIDAPYSDGGGYSSPLPFVFVPNFSSVGSDAPRTTRQALPRINPNLSPDEQRIAHDRQDQSILKDEAQMAGNQTPDQQRILQNGYNMKENDIKSAQQHEAQLKADAQTLQKIQAEGDRLQSPPTDSQTSPNNTANFTPISNTTNDTLTYTPADLNYTPVPDYTNSSACLCTPVNGPTPTPVGAAASNCWICQYDAGYAQVGFGAGGAVAFFGIGVQGSVSATVSVSTDGEMNLNLGFVLGNAVGFYGGASGGLVFGVGPGSSPKGWTFGFGGGGALGPGVDGTVTNNGITLSPGLGYGAYAGAVGGYTWSIPLNNLYPPCGSHCL